MERIGDARLPTRHGDFRAVSYRALDGHEHLAIVAGEPAGQTVLTRLHSECLTGDALGSLKCDCGEQLDHALASIREAGRGVVVYLRGHEGRGIGLAAKIRAYELQDAGLDTVDANTAQGLPIDDRSYDVAAAILADLDVTSVRLLSNNPAKGDGLVAHGIRVAELVPIMVASTELSQAYVRTKIERLGHRAG
ncbi:MAG: GTP cyclohydrolase II [Actinomycetota bacterium]